MDEIKEVTGKTYNKIVIAGGGSQADILNQYIANATGLNVITGPSEATVLGNAIVQFIAKKEIECMDEGRKIIASSFEGKIYMPKDKEKWANKYSRYLKKMKEEREKRNEKTEL